MKTFKTAYQIIAKKRHDKRLPDKTKKAKGTTEKFGAIHGKNQQIMMGILTDQFSVDTRCGLRIRPVCTRLILAFGALSHALMFAMTIFPSGKILNGFEANKC